MCGVEARKPNTCREKNEASRRAKMIKWRERRSWQDFNIGFPRSDCRAALGIAARPPFSAIIHRRIIRQIGSFRKHTNELRLAERIINTAAKRPEAILFGFKVVNGALYPPRFALLCLRTRDEPELPDGT